MSSQKCLTRSIFFLLIVFILAGYAGTTGKIVGQVFDKTTGDPLPGANILLEGSVLGAATDMDGSFIIMGVPPGEYTVRASMISFRDMVQTKVSISVDKTTRLKFELVEAALELGETIEVTAERPIVKKDLTSTESAVSSEVIENLPVENFTDVVNLQAGVVDGHFRGGRKNEVVYMVNGIPVNDAYTGDVAIEVENNAIQELTVISGTFNAEYGQAMSGVVNIVTKDGGQNYEGKATIYGGDFVSGNDDKFWNIDKFNPLFNVQGNLSGPLPFFSKKVTFFASGRYYKTDGYLYGREVFLPTDVSDFNADNKENWRIQSQGVDYPFSREVANDLMKNADAVAMNNSERYSANIKLTYRPAARDKISIDGIYQIKTWEEYDHRFRLNPTGNYQREQHGLTSSVAWNHIFSPRTFLDVRYSFFETRYEQNVYEDYFDLRYVPDIMLQNSSSNAFLSAGQQMWHFNRSTNTNLVKIDLTSQMTDNHQVKIGVEGKRHRLWMHEFEVVPELESRVNPKTNFNNNEYLNKPAEYSAFFQDKMEFDYMVVNAGVRMDYFDPDGQVPVDFQNPSTSARKDSDPTVQISPRFGIAYPISATGVLHVSYGHFFQTPNFFYLYTNPEFDIFKLQGTPSPPPQSLLNTVGNTDLKPQKTVIYEIGLQQQLGTMYGVSLTAYYKDIRNLLGTQVLRTFEGYRYARYINRDYGFVRGITFEFEKRHFDKISASIDYTYQIAKGNASDPNTAFLDAQADPPNETEKQVVPLNWDRRHQLNATITIGEPGNYAMSIIGRYGTGLPYTPTLRSTQSSVENGGRKPDIYNVDLYVYKNLNMFGLKYSVFFRAFNLFDRLNEKNVFTDTGRAGYTLAVLYEGEPRGINTLDEYFVRPDYYSEPRKIQLGLEIEF